MTESKKWLREYIVRGERALSDEMAQEILDYITMLEQEVMELNTILNNIHNYIEKMSYCEVVDNPKKELSRILEKGE